MKNNIPFVIKFDPMPPYGGHRDLWLMIPQWELARCYDSYYFALSDTIPLPDYVKKGSLEATKYKLLYYLGNWSKHLYNLKISEQIFFHLGLWDEYIEGLVIRKTEVDVFELSLGDIMIEGCAIDPLRLDTLMPNEVKAASNRSPIQVLQTDFISAIEASVVGITNVVVPS
jgi:hypothetical protein